MQYDGRNSVIISKSAKIEEYVSQFFSHISLEGYAIPISNHSESKEELRCFTINSNQSRHNASIVKKK